MFDLSLRLRPFLWSAILGSASLAGCGSEPTETPSPPASTAPPTPSDVSEASISEDSDDWTTGITRLDAEAEGIVTVQDARVASHLGPPGYDRVAFTFESGQPEVHIEYVDKPVHACGSGDQLFPEGDGYLQIRLSGAQAHTEAGSPTLPHERQVRDLLNLRETVPTCDFEGEVTWVLGLASPEPYRVVRLEAPDRLAVDVRHPSGE